MTNNNKDERPIRSVENIATATTQLKPRPKQNDLSFNKVLERLSAYVESKDIPEDAPEGAKEAVDMDMSALVDDLVIASYYGGVHPFDVSEMIMKSFHRLIIEPQQAQAMKPGDGGSVN